MNAAYAVNVPFTITLSGPALTLNKERTLHWSEVKGITQGWRESAGWMAASRRRLQRVPAFPCGIEVHVFQPTRGGLADAAGHFPVAKAAIDGIRDAKVLPDDSPTYVAWTRLHAPTKDKSVAKGTVRLEIALVEA